MSDKEDSMKKQQPAPITAEYQIGTTKYTVKPICNETDQKESIEEKIKRLILQDRQKGAKL